MHICGVLTHSSPWSTPTFTSHFLFSRSIIRKETRRLLRIVSTSIIEDLR
jgi:hypothetical protein